jgi:hypothetical protein
VFFLLLWYSISAISNQPGVDNDGFDGKISEKINYKKLGQNLNVEMNDEGVEHRQYDGSEFEFIRLYSFCQKFILLYDL